MAIGKYLVSTSNSVIITQLPLLPITIRLKQCTPFFGGIAQNYKDSSGNTVKDNDIPFVKTISVVERSDNKVKEYVLPEKLSGYFGAAAEFISVNEKLFAENGIMNIDKLNKSPLWLAI